MAPPSSLSSMRYRSNYAACLLCGAIVTSAYVFSSRLFAGGFAALSGPEAARSHSDGDVGRTERKPLLSLHGKGRLGNQMFRFSALVGLATRHGRRMSLSGRNGDLRSTFPNIRVRTDGSCGSRMKRLRLRDFGTYNATFEMLPDDDICAEGYFQSWRYFRDVEKTLRAQFVFASKVRRRADTLYARVLAKGSLKMPPTVVGVHVRRGDIMKLKKFNLPTASYYLKAMRYFKQQTRNVNFVVVSNDIKWCKTNLNVYPRMAFFSNNSAAVDLALLSSCQHTIISVGTFGWWGAWLAGGSVVYFDNFISKSSEIFGAFNPSDYYPPHWIPMGD